MTFIGKLLAGLIMIASAVFLLAAISVFATHSHWRDAAKENEVDLKKAVKANLEARAKLSRIHDKVAIEKAARRYALAALQSRMEHLERTLLLREEQSQQYLAAKGQLEETSRVSQVNLEQLRTEVSTLRTDVLAAHAARDQTFDSVVDLTARVRSKVREVVAAVVDEKKLRGTVSDMKLVMDYHDLTIHTPIAQAPPRLNGVVTSVGEKNTIEISIGSDVGIRKGYALEVYRNSSYLGRVVVRHVEPNRAVCQILPQYRQGNIRRGDRVATRFS